MACRRGGCANIPTRGYYCDSCRVVRYESAFWRKVDKTPTCWNWIGARKPTGYGNFYAGSYVIAHRYAYEIMVGSIPEGLNLDHICRNRSCVNPAHLEPVTQRENCHRAEPSGTAAMWAARTACHKCGGEMVDTIREGRSRWRTCQDCGPARSLIMGAA